MDGSEYLLLLTGDREYGETALPSSSGRALLALTEYYDTERKRGVRERHTHTHRHTQTHTRTRTRTLPRPPYTTPANLRSTYTKKAPLDGGGGLQAAVLRLGVLDLVYAGSQQLVL